MLLTSASTAGLRAPTTLGRRAVERLLRAGGDAHSELLPLTQKRLARENPHTGEAFSWSRIFTILFTSVVGMGLFTVKRSVPLPEK